MLDAELSKSRGTPTRDMLTAPVRLLHYHSADVTSHTRALLRQNDVLQDARRISRAQVPRRGDAPVSEIPRAGRL